VPKAFTGASSLLYYRKVKKKITSAFKENNFSKKTGANYEILQ